MRFCWHAVYPIRCSSPRRLWEEPFRRSPVPVFRGCAYGHQIAGQGGSRGPDLATVADRQTRDGMTIRILNGGANMTALAANLTSQQLDAVVAFLETRKASRP